MMKTLIVQELKTENDVNGNPRKLLSITLLESYHRNGQTRYIEVGYEDVTTTMENTKEYKESVSIHWLPTINITPKEYKRLKRL